LAPPALTALAAAPTAWPSAASLPLVLPGSPGTVTVTRVCCGNPTAGVNTAVSPARRHEPATAGVTVGSSAEAGSGWL